jgi:catechol 2,3-dioxygenase-like lactoylglutathione lyase family enzyme
MGPVSLFVENLDEALRFYRDMLGFTVTESTAWRGERCVFLRANTEHHGVALYPIALRAKLGFSAHTTSMALGLQLANYRQLRAAADFLRANGARIVEVDPAVHPGIAYAVHVLDPDGHALQLYHEMEQVGWDGLPRPLEQRRTPITPWPEVLEPTPDTYTGEPYLGPWR